ncbi:LA_2272 family surface repeat-containing protein [Photobacterium chitinilyticum]|uniref:PhaC PHA synthase n=1 Tax=Photobacterium chitinilyticum TaxID=2485123 RepID=A0A444JWC5_9GAMM|nr:hypothetical protein [Photobacterium chitinilyticum]RWX57384.1 hypothetical protein EDI28_04975 [Photobacterium chitinilyticum]
MKTTVSALLLTVAISAPAFAEQAIQLSVPDANFPPGNVKGVRVTILHGKTSQVTGLDIPILGISETQNFSGLSVGFLFGISRVTGSSTGVKLGLANWNDGNVKGADLGFANYNAGQFTGLQLGAFNYTGRLNGLQFGFINATDRIEKGVQIGLINYDKSGTFLSKDIPVFPLINARF